MRFDVPLIPGALIKRYKRFLVDVRLDDGAVVTAHTPNTGRLAGCLAFDSRVWLSESDNPKRKFRYTWEIASDGEVAVGVHTGRANGLAEEVIAAGELSELAGYDRIRREVRYGESSRIDLLLERDSPAERCYVEVKNVTLGTDGVAYFPDAVTARGRKHLVELQAMVAEGHRAAMVYVVQRIDCKRVAPADHIDPAYGETLREAIANGVEAYGLRFDVAPSAITFDRTLPVLLPSVDPDHTLGV